MLKKIKIGHKKIKKIFGWDPSDPIGPNIDQNLHLQFLSEIFFKNLFFYFFCLLRKFTNF